MVPPGHGPARAWTRPGEVKVFPNAGLNVLDSGMVWSTVPVESAERSDVETRYPR